MTGRDSGRAAVARRGPGLMLAGVLAAAGVLLSPATPAAAAPAYRLMLAGDSITQGSSGDYTWRYRLWRKLDVTAPGDVVFVGTRTDLYDTVNGRHGSGHYADLSFGGRAHTALWGTTYNAQKALVADQVTSSGANTLVVLLGLNDIAWLGRTPAQVVSDLDAYVAAARAADAGIDIVLGEALKPYDPWTGTVRFEPQLNELNRLIGLTPGRLNTTASRVVVALTATGWHADGQTWDGTHPNPTGETLIAQRVSEALASIGVGTSSPGTYASTPWNVRGPAVTVTPAPQRAALSWNRTSTGATGMFVEQRLVWPGQAWQRLPYVVPGDSFSAGLLAAGWTYEFRIAPSKGFNTGIPGNATRATIP
jgi:lysophospholipase L1-like esterase